MKKFGRRTREEAQRLTTDRLRSRATFMRSGWLYGLYRFLPFWVIRLLPAVQQDLIEQFRREEEATETPSEASETPSDLSEIPILGAPYYAENYRCLAENPLSCDFPRQSIDEDREAKYCVKCGFPALLPPKAEILGKRGRYRILAYLGRRGKGRLYQAVQLSNSKPTIVKEYLLPKRYFNDRETRQTQEVFENIGGFVLADNRQQDFRLLTLWDAIADRQEERCYTITSGETNNYPSLRTYLQKNGAMGDREILHFLNQVLQSLESLHQQKYRLRSGQIQPHLAHGNLSLDSLLIKTADAPFYSDPQFWIYLTDFGLWEQRLDPPPLTEQPLTVAQDLTDLGRIAFSLRHGSDTLDPRQARSWSPDLFPDLKRYLMRLMGFELPFENAKIARQALPILPAETTVATLSTVDEIGDSSPSRRWLWWLLLTAIALLIGGSLGWWWLRRQATATVPSPVMCCLDRVAALPTGKFAYTADRNGIWNYAVVQKNLVERGKTLGDIFNERLPDLTLVYRPQDSLEDAIAAIRTGKAEFAITALSGPPDRSFKEEIIAYDTLVIFVPFSYDRRENSLPHALNGRITYQQLRQLYSGEIDNWREIGGPDLPVRLYMPRDREVVRIFEEKVLQNEDAIAKFRSRQQAETDAFTLENSIQTLPTFTAMQTLLREFEQEQAGGISFGSLSQVFNQCSVYPLAIVADNQTAIQPLITFNNQSINPQTDLCNAKGSYYPDLEILQNNRYPLVYPIKLIYPLDNSRPTIGEHFAEALKTQESQELLAKVGFIPLSVPVNFNP